MATKQVDLKELRKKLKLSQVEFWSTLGVTQSGGSRYESGRDIPEPTRMLLELVYLGTTPNALRKLENLREAAKGAGLHGNVQVKGKKSVKADVPPAVEQ